MPLKSLGFSFTAVIFSSLVSADCKNISTPYGTMNVDTDHGRVELYGNDDFERGKTTSNYQIRAKYVPQPPSSNESGEIKLRSKKSDYENTMNYLISMDENREPTEVLLRPVSRVKGSDPDNPFNGHSTMPGQTLIYYFKTGADGNCEITRILDDEAYSTRKIKFDAELCSNLNLIMSGKIKGLPFSTEEALTFEVADYRQKIAKEIPKTELPITEGPSTLLEEATKIYVGCKPYLKNKSKPAINTSPAPNNQLVLVNPTVIVPKKTR